MGTDNAWYPDSGSINHFTAEFSNLNLQANEHTRTDKIRVGNGQSLPIHQIGLSKLPSLNSDFNLHNLLHFPLIRKNFISASQFTRDNNVTIEF
jgi:hypothetical protein